MSANAEAKAKASPVQKRRTTASSIAARLGAAPKSLPANQTSRPTKPTRAPSRETAHGAAPAATRAPRAPTNPDSPVLLDATRCYRALTARDRRFDGRFFVGVVTTGVYCRPVCPAPTPRAKNVRFFACAAAAEASGFRPCKRCRPETSPGTPAWVGSSAVVGRALRMLSMSGGQAPALAAAQLAERLGVGERHLRRLFLAHLGAPPGAIARASRVHLARRLLDETALSITDVAFAAGFESVRQFNHALRSVFRAAPRDLRRRARAIDGNAHANKNGDGSGGGSTRGSEARSRKPSAKRGSVAIAQPASARARLPGLAGGGRAGEILRLRLAYRPPLDWPALLGFLAARALPGVETVVDGEYRRTIALDGSGAILSLRPVAEKCHVVLTLQALPPREPRSAPKSPDSPDSPDSRGALAGISRIVARARHLLDLDADPGRIAAHLRRSPVLAASVRLRPGLRVPGAFDPFELAVRAILGQQVTVRGAAQLAGRIAARLGEPIHAPETPALACLFPSPERIRDADLAAIGMPETRARAIRSLAAIVADGTLDLGATADPGDVVTRLVALPGIGEWTAEYVAMRALGEPDAFPASDLGLRRALSHEGTLPSSRELAELAEAWRPWRAYAALHLWQIDRAKARNGTQKIAEKERSLPWR
jgi:AraC family transcriptional regulator, regulatory protein of adaptative response / DNA-3-methyladenine glycosylase II